MTIRLPSLGLGAASLGNLFEAMTDEAAGAIVERAFEAGIRYFDTAPFYGFGLSERRLGNGLRARDGVLLSTKVGRLLRPAPGSGGIRYGFASPMPFEPGYDYSYDGVMRSYEDSLQRLGLARVDVLLVHDIGEATHGEDADRHWRDLFDGGYRALDDLRSAGVVGAIGLGVNETEACLTAMRHGRFDLCLLAGRYSLLEQHPLETLLPAAQAVGTRIIAAGVFHSGILATGTASGAALRHDYGPASDQVIAHVRRIEAVCKAYGVALPAAALQFPGRHPAVESTLVGIANVAQLESMLLWHATPIPAAFWDALKDERLIPAKAPVD